MKAFFTLTLCAGSFAFSHHTLAKNSGLGRQSIGVERIVIKGKHWPQTLHLVGSSLTIIDEEALRLSQAIVISDILSQMPGISSSRNGGVGTTTSLNIRGAETHQTLVVIDGVKVYDPSLPSGGFNFSNLLVSDIERIEILRGAKSTLWGQQAIGAVINITTRSPQKPLETYTSLEAGSQRTSYGRIGTGGFTDRLTWQLASRYYMTDGLSTFAEGSESDGYYNTGVNGKIRFAVTENIELDLRGSYSLGRHQFDSGFPLSDTSHHGTTEDWLGHASVNFSLLNHRLQNRIAFDYTDTHREDFNPTQGVGFKTFDSIGAITRWYYQGLIPIFPNWEAIFGLEYEESSMKKNLPLPPLSASVYLTSGYAQIQGEVLEDLVFTGGVRHSHHETFGSHTLGETSLVWTPNKGPTLFWLNFGQGFQAPTLYQLYSPYGNLTLQPEKANNWDLGWQQELFEGKVVVSTTGFYRITQNQIDFTNCTNEHPLCSPEKFGFYDNALRIRAHGIELAASLKNGPLGGYVSYTYIDTKNTSKGSPYQGRELARRPKHLAHFWLNYTWPPELTTGVALRYYGKSFDDRPNNQPLEAHILVDFRTSWKIHSTLEMYGRIENLFDETYQTAFQYGSPRRGFFFGLRRMF